MGCYELYTVYVMIGCIFLLAFTTHLNCKGYDEKDFQRKMKYIIVSIFFLFPLTMAFL
jgi:hypothetical protein